MRDRLEDRAAALVVPIGAMWATYFFLQPLNVVYGIVPRTTGGLAGILMAPFLHGSLQHLLGNTIAFAILGAVVLLRGVDHFISVCMFTAIVAGGGTWLFGLPNTMHVGASGVIFGLIGYLILRGWYERTVGSIAIGILIAIFYAGEVLFGLVPRQGIGWAAHFFGFVGGVLAARHFHQRRRRALL